jgi:hypothetical protein
MLIDYRATMPIALTRQFPMNRLGSTGSYEVHRLNHEDDQRTGGRVWKPGGGFKT